jgi:hypothetical protein
MSLPVMAAKVGRLCDEIIGLATHWTRKTRSYWEAVPTTAISLVSPSAARLFGRARTLLVAECYRRVFYHPMIFSISRFGI